MSEVRFRIRNNALRSFGFAGRLCIAGSGNVTPPEAAKQLTPEGTPFRLPPLFELDEKEMFRSFRGVVAAMAEHTPAGRPAIEVYVDGVTTPLTVKDIGEWAADYRARNGYPEPKSRDDHAREVERAMDRPEDILERQHRLVKEREQQTLVTAVAATVIEVLRQQAALAAAPPAPPLAAAPAGRARGRNDEKD